MQIAIDGPAGSGKTSLAKALAEALGYIHMDTGAMFRAVSFVLCEEEIREEKAIEERLRSMELRMIPGGVEIDGRPLCAELRTERIDKEVSYYSQLAPVRSWLLQQQRELAAGHDVILDGRDIGTVVLPDAQVKIYLEASKEVRARRRALQTKKPQDYARILADIERRDRVDSGREIAPLRPARDARIIDTSAMTFEEVLDCIRRIVEEYV